MRNYREPTELEFDRMIEGAGPAWDPALSELSSIVQDLRSAYTRPISPGAERRHIAAMVAEASSTSGRLHRVITKQVEGLKTSLGPLLKAPSTRVRRLVLANLVGTALGKAVLALTAAAATTTGLAATGSLPAPIQAVVVSAAHNLGISAHDEVSATPQVHAPQSPVPAAPLAPPAPASAPDLSPPPAVTPAPPQEGTGEVRAYPQAPVTADRTANPGRAIGQPPSGTTEGRADGSNPGSTAGSSHKQDAEDWWKQRTNDRPANAGDEQGPDQRSGTSGTSWNSYSDDWWRSWSTSWDYWDRR